MIHPSSTLKRDPENVQAWLVGSGIPSLAAAVHLIREANVPGRNIHILDLRPGSGGELTTPKETLEGYFLPFECHPHIYSNCTEALLSLIPDRNNPGKCLMDDIHEFEHSAQPPQEDEFTRAIRLGHSGPQAVYTRGIHLGFKYRMDLIRFILQSETALGSKSISDIFDEHFFETGFWMLWSTTFAFQPWHSAVEFRRHLRKYLEDIQSLNNVKRSHRTKYNLFESIVAPIMEYLKEQGVDFLFHVEVKDLLFYPESDPTTVSEIKLNKSDREHLVTLDPEDICLVDLGFSRSGVAFGSNDLPPSFLSSNWEDLMMKEWNLWQTLSKKTPKFGNPANYLLRALESGIETFTTTLQGATFMELYENITHNQPGTGTMLSLVDSNWDITLSIPHQPVFSTQPGNVNVICGYALNPSNEGNFVKKAMFACSGREIFTEVLSHFGISHEQFRDTATTIPCGEPLGTAAFLTRSEGDRPLVIPENTTNIAFIGQFAELPEDTTLSMEYSVRTAQTAVYELLGLEKAPSGVKKNIVVEVFDLLK
ncbi:hypothetical protein EYZ11_005964 [Aspergillus tanneri]|uniref:Oleate hydratase n=1 Tax=Aspergillus tanneri TaxID=1220188 RepID=A0A4S3JH82_9EURO|nr:uncharacterized protein ATNIH1004_002272 [Aspergillus tanneri]KAA8649601.1 hypothetical protein ATNIH1004_002272 [Aspergillus tanneri]THC94565.1 hypothetical protein EYZ11_005964 [Aspergillus tanneri]